MTITISEINRLNEALAAVAAGFAPDGNGAPKRYVLRTAAAKYAVVRNQRECRTALEDANDTLRVERERLLALDWTDEGKKMAWEKFVLELNLQEEDVDLIQFPREDLDIDAMNGAEAMAALLTLDEFLLIDSQPA